MRNEEFFDDVKFPLIKIEKNHEGVYLRYDL